MRRLLGTIAFLWVLSLSGVALAAEARSGVDLASDDLREAVTLELAGEELPTELDVVGGDSVVIEALVRDGRGGDARDAIRGAGGEISGAVAGEVIQATIPVENLVELEADAAIASLRPPLDYNQPDERESENELTLTPEEAPGAVVGAEVAKTGANLWHAAGITGSGIKIGIIDNFNGASYNAAVAADEIPTPTGTICRNLGASCSIFAASTKHGVGVTEIVADMAPSAQIYLATATSAADAQAAVNFFATQGVDVITRSETGRFDGPGNGTGPIAAVIDSAIAQGMTYVNSGGNAAGRNGAQGGYWRGLWSDPDSDDVLNFSGTDEFLKYDCAFVSGLRWSDWGEGALSTDYDVQVYSGPSTGSTLLDSSIDAQGGSGSAPPLELATTCGAAGADAYLHVTRYATNGGDTADTLEFKTNGIGVEHFSNPFSAGGPMADSANPGMLSVGAIDPALGTTIGNYSAEGPTNDGRLKPDISAASCVASFTYSPACFNGTSAAAPVVAAAAALVLSDGRATTPQQVKSFLTSAVTDRGAPGADQVYGTGELTLPEPDRTAPAVQALKAKGKAGKRISLGYFVADASGQSGETVAVFNQKGKTTATFAVPLAPTAEETRSVTYRAPRKVKGTYLFCVTSSDSFGNASAASCAQLKIKNKKKKHRR